MDYRFERFPELAHGDGFNYPIDVYHHNIHLGTLIALPHGFMIRLLDSPTGKITVFPSPHNYFKTEDNAAYALHRIWSNLRKGSPPRDAGDTVPVEMNEIGFPSQPKSAMTPSREPVQGKTHLLVPDYDPIEPKPYPGNIKPGYYSPKQVVQLMINHIDNPDALQFIADIFETGENDEFWNWLRANKNNTKLLHRRAAEWQRKMANDPRLK